MKESGRANALLVELLLVIFFFMISAAILVQVYADAKLKSRTAQATNAAMLEGQNIAEDLYGTEDPETVLKEYGFTVYLQVTAHEAATRISDLSTRPLFGDLEHAQKVFDMRLPLYEEVADVQIETAGRGTGLIAREVFRRLKEEGIVWQPR